MHRQRPTAARLTGHVGSSQRRHAGTRPLHARARSLTPHTHTHTHTRASHARTSVADAMWGATTCAAASFGAAPGAQRRVRTALDIESRPLAISGSFSNTSKPTCARAPHWRWLECWRRAARMRCTDWHGEEGSTEQQRRSEANTKGAAMSATWKSGCFFRWATSASSSMTGPRLRTTRHRNRPRPRSAHRAGGTAYSPCAGCVAATIHSADTQCTL